MVAIINKLLSFTWLGDLAEKVNGSKTWIGLFALVVHLLNIVPVYFPQYGISVEIAARIQQVLMYLGVLLPVGVAHKVVKAVDSPDA